MGLVGLLWGTKGAGGGTGLQVILKEARFFGVVELLLQGLQFSLLLENEIPHPLMFERVVGDARRVGVVALFLFLVALFVVEELLFYQPFLFGSGGKLGGLFGRRLPLFLLFASQLLGVEGLSVFYFLLLLLQLELLCRHFLFSLLFSFLLFVFAAKRLRRLACLDRPCFVVTRRQREDRRRGRGRR